MSLGARIRLEREQRGWTQRNLASAAGCSQARVSLYESGKKSPEPCTLRRLSDALDIPLDVFLLEAIEEEEVLEAQLAVQRAIREVERVRALSRGVVREALSITVEGLNAVSNRLTFESEEAAKCRRAS